uniref:Secreted protein n=1 Tax=Strongyloides papillosus TaxID=174720 RepID=A0A0N5C866_STREA
MKFFNFVFIGLAASAGAKSIVSRSSGYGDEAVTPAPVTEAPAPAGGYGGPAPVAPVAPAPVEQTVTETKQEYNAVVEQPKVEQSGYRKKRGAAYGDEAVTPAPVTEAPAPAGGYGGPAPVAPVAPAPVETVVTETKQDYNAAPSPSVPETQPSGY